MFALVALVASVHIHLTDSTGWITDSHLKNLKCVIPYQAALWILIRVWSELEIFYRSDTDQEHARRGYE
jgi:hypothetical protein